MENCQSDLAKAALTDLMPTQSLEGFVLAGRPSAVVPMTVAEAAFLLSNTEDLSLAELFLGDVSE